MKTITISKQGSRSEFNEDASLALPAQGVFLVSDGVGGGPSGHEASRKTVETLYEVLSGIEVSEAKIVDSIDLANNAVFENAQNGANKGMACTLALLWKSGNELRCFNIGDSRIYRVRDGQIFQLTKDQIKRVKRNNKVKALVTNAIGIKQKVFADVSHWDWKGGDLLMLMSDGISDVVSDNEMCELVSSSELSMLDKGNALIHASIKNGSLDDKTLVLAF